ncbi:MAG TPA: MdtA/MuxA family multidrug efflux RND transporter periplasmic adaptor subunit [Rhodopila sp.]|nr:MdtA/MuxA family multidrug efflux RND transporter periplasmic adaptor subunit [Rhodopila sp.]
MDERVDRRETTTIPADRPTPMTRVPRRSRTRRLILPAVVLILLAGGGALWWTQHKAGPVPTFRGGASGFKTPPQPVGFATVDKGDINITLDELGTVTPLKTVTVQTQINGQLIDVGFKEGQVVKAGDFLAQIDPRPYQVALEQAQGTLAHDQGLLDQAKADLKRYQTLGRQDSIAQQQVEDQKYLVEQYAGTVKADQGVVDNAKLNLIYCHITSPIDGQIGLRLVDPGNYVQTTSTTGIAVVTLMQPISVIFSVPQGNLPDIIQRLRGGATLPVEAYDSGNTRHLATGKLMSLDNQIDTTTGTLRLRAIFDNPDEMLYPNQFVNARLLVDTMHDTVRVPVQAVQRGEPGTFVYVINANDTVAVRKVEVGPADNGYQAVLSGLTPGERVVTDGTDRLRDGAQVSLPQAHAAPQAQMGSANLHHAGVPPANVQPTGAQQPAATPPPTTSPPAHPPGHARTPSQAGR